MINPKDLYCYATTEQIGDTGQSLIQYEIHRYRDVRSLGNALAYVVICTHRVIVPGIKPYHVGANPDAFSGYQDYLAALTNSLELEVSPASPASTIVLRELFPRTLNANISTSLDTQIGNSSSSSIQHSTGSSTSQSNTFGVGVSGGFFGELPVFNISSEYQHGWNSGKSHSSESGTGREHQSSSSSGETMSVKDWSAYGRIDAANQSASWVWGQSYPWDVVLYNQSKTTSHVILPPFIQSRLMTTLTQHGDDGKDTHVTFALPPSQLSLFGIDFTMKAGWLIEFPHGVDMPETIKLTHNVVYHTASHKIMDSGAKASISAEIHSGIPTAFTSPALDLSTYALDPIADVKNGAAINFTNADLFRYPPTSSNQGSFRIVSTANTLLVTGKGFADTASSNFSQGEVEIVVDFKILDTTDEYSLLFHHWIGVTGHGVNLSVIVNRNKPITLLVDAQEGQGGQGNISSIKLRDLDFASVDFHDYLQLGLNKIVIKATATDASKPTLYTLSALAIGQG